MTKTEINLILDLENALRQFVVESCKIGLDNYKNKDFYPLLDLARSLSKQLSAARGKNL